MTPSDAIPEAAVERAARALMEANGCDAPDMPVYRDYAAGDLELVPRWTHWAKEARSALSASGYAEVNEKAKALLEQWYAFQGTEYRNQEDAYYKLAKNAHAHWRALAEAIRKMEQS